MGLLCNHSGELNHNIISTLVWIRSLMAAVMILLVIICCIVLLPKMHLVLHVDKRSFCKVRIITFSLTKVLVEFI